MGNHIYLKKTSNDTMGIKRKHTISLIYKYTVNFPTIISITFTDSVKKFVYKRTGSPRIL
jgi:hypothetical protein